MRSARFSNASTEASTPKRITRRNTEPASYLTLSCLLSNSPHPSTQDHLSSDPASGTRPAGRPPPPLGLIWMLGDYSRGRAPWGKIISYANWHPMKDEHPHLADARPRKPKPGNKKLLKLRSSPTRGSTTPGQRRGEGGGVGRSYW